MTARGPGLLVVLAGRPGTGKSTIARRVAQRTGATWLRIDSIETALMTSRLGLTDVADAGYAVARAVARDALSLGGCVIADSVNPLPVTQDAWRAVAAAAKVPLLEVEVTCSDARRHRTRVESRGAEIDGHVHPTWAEVQNRTYQSPPAPAAVLDTARLSPDQSADRLIALISEALEGN